MRIRLTVVAGLLAFTIGCGESVEHKLEQAKVSLNSGRPDAALTYAQAVLTERPSDQTAMLLVAKAHLRLRHYEDSRQMLQKLVKLDPAKAENHRELLNLALAEMTDLLNASEFNTNAALAERFTAAKEQGHAEADWLATTGKEVAASEFARARLLMLDSHRIGKIINDEENRIRGESSVREGTAPVTSAAIEEQRRQVKGLLASAEKHLENTYAADPANFQAVSILVRLLRDREGWNDLWILAGKLQAREDLPAALASDMVASLLTMPDRLYAEGIRLEASRKLMAAVSPQGRASPQWKIVRARLHLKDREKDKAIELAQEAFRAQPNDVETRLTYAWCLYETAQYPLAKTMLETLASEQRNHEHVQLLYGLTLTKTGDMTLAAEALRRTTDINPTNQIARTELVKILGSNRDNISVVLEDINKLYQANAGDPDAIRFKFMAEVATDSRSNVKSLLTAVEKISPLKPGHLRVLVDGFIYLKDPEQAMKYAMDWAKMDEGQIEPQMAVARVHLIRNQLDQARRVLVALSEKFPGSPAVNETLIQLYLNQGSFDKAIELSSGLIKERPENNSARLMLAMALNQLSLTEEALDQTKEILNRTPDEPRALELAASILRMAGQPDLAQAYLEKIDESKIDESMYPGVLAQLKLQKGDIGEATAICNRAIAAGSTDPRIRLTLASIHSRSKNPGEEEIHLIAFVREHPNNHLGFQMLARFYALNNVERGIAQLQSMRTVNEPLARIAEAGLHRSIGRSADAVQALADLFQPMVQRRDPLVWIYARNLAGAMVQRDQSTKNASSIYDILIERNINAARAALAQLDMLWPELDDAARLSRLKLIEPRLSPDDMPAVTATVTRYAMARRADMAIALVDHWMGQRPSDASLPALRGEILTQAGRFADAIESYRQSVKLEPEVALHYERLALALMRAGDYAAAEKVYDQMGTIDIGTKISSLWGKGNLFLHVGLDQQAVSTFSELDKIGRRGDPRVLLVLGRGLIGLGRDDEARKSLLLIPPHSSHFGVAQVLLVRLEMKSGALESARSRLNLLAKDPKTVGAAVRELVTLNFRQGNDAQLLDWSDAVLKLDELPPAYRSQWLTIRFAIQSKNRDWPALEKTLGIAHAGSLNPSSVLAARVGTLIHLKKMEEAKSLLQSDRALLSSPGGALLSVALGMPVASIDQMPATTQVFHALSKGDLATARSAAARVLPLTTTTFRSDYVEWLGKAPQDAEQLAAKSRQFALALVMRDAALPALAEDICKSIIKDAPTFAPAYSLLLQTLEEQQMSLGDTQKAVIAAFPDSSLALYCQAILAGKEGTPAQLGKAIELTQKALARESQHEWLQYHLAGLFRAAGQFDQAIDTLKTLHPYANRLRPIVTNDLAYRIALHQPQNLPTAYSLAKGLVEAVPTVAAYKDTLAWIEHLRGNNDEAMRLMTSVIPELRASAEVHHHMGVVYQAKGNVTWAKYHLAVAAKKGDPAILKDAQERIKQLAAE